MFRARNSRPERAQNHKKTRLLKCVPRKLRGSWPKTRVSPIFPGPNHAKPPLFAWADFWNQQTPKRNQHFYVESSKDPNQINKIICYFLLRRLHPQTGHKDHPTQPQEAPRRRKPSFEASNNEGFGGGRRQRRSLKIYYWLLLLIIRIADYRCF